MRRVCLLSLLLGLLTPAAASYAQTADTLRTSSGIRYVLYEHGSGPTAQPGDRMVVNYSGFLPSGKVFDSSAMDGRPVRFRVGKGEVIKGWDEVLPLLPAGTRARLYVPAALAYGAKGVRNPDDPDVYLIPPNTDLIFELTVLKVK